MISFEEAQGIILGSVKQLGTEKVGLHQALNRVLSDDLASKVDSPIFDNSAVDGYALCEADLGQGDCNLRLDGEIEAGFTGTVPLIEPGTAVRVLTGSRIPANTATIVMQEDVVVEGGRATLNSNLASGLNIRRRGEEYEAGHVVLESGTLLNPPAIAVAASAGYDQLEVVRNPKVGILVTGSELVTPGSELQEGQIYESNALGLQSALSSLGINEIKIEREPDNFEQTKKTLGELLSSCDVVISSGGVSVGTKDYVKGACEACGVQELFWRVAVKPGKPIYFGKTDEGAVFFGLPGNPVSALVTFALFAVPALQKMLGRAATTLTQNCQLLESYSHHPGRLEFVRGVRSRDTVKALEKQGSSMSTGLAEANCLIELSAAESTFEAGTTVTTWDLPWSTI